MQVPDRPLTNDEQLYYLRRQRALEKAEQELDRQWQEQAEVPTLWFGRLAGIAVGSLSLAAVLWVTVFLDPRINYWVSGILMTIMIAALLGIAGLVVRGFVVGNRQNQALADLRENFVYTESANSDGNR